MTSYSLICPVRGVLRNTGKSSDGLTQNEEFQRVQAIRHLVDHGYPPDRIKVEVIEKRFGSGGRNSFRCDFAVFDQPVANLAPSVDEMLDHAVLLCEVKRDSAKSSYVKSTQVEPMLDFARRKGALGLFWSEDYRRLYWHEYDGERKRTKEAPLAALPHYLETPEAPVLTFNSLLPCPSLLDVFSKIEDVLHGFGVSKEERYEAIFQLLLAKLFDEHMYETRTEARLDLQDFDSLGYTPKAAAKEVGEVIHRAVNFYQAHLPKKIPIEMTMPEEATLDVMSLLAPFKIIASKRDVIQTFYMKFAKDMYKWEMAQYFTPTRISDFVVQIANPQFGEHICDPACGSADFLVGAFRYGKRYNPGYADSVFGYDNSRNAVQVAVLNMVLNGDGKSNIRLGDSLAGISELENRYDLMLCNPPFGSKITEKRAEVLAQFDLGHSLTVRNGAVSLGNVLDKQETGILFVEACIKACRKTGGRIAIVLPNGYLGNTGEKFRSFRDWLLCHASIASVVSLPRFTFKASGADVSASIVFMDVREVPLSSTKEAKGEPINFELVERLGWEAGTKRQNPVYVRDQETGALEIDATGEKVIDCDYDDVLADLFNSQAAFTHRWLLKGRERAYKDGTGWSVESDRIIADPDHSLDPKFWCRKNQEHLANIAGGDHFRLDELVDFIAEGRTADGKAARKCASKQYSYVDLTHMATGSCDGVPMRGWELPSRARHFAESGDIFVGSIWGSAGKWCVAPTDCDGMVVTNGCFRLRMKSGMEQFRTDLLSYFTTESWRSQARAQARGSDGLAEIPVSAASRFLVPKLTDAARSSLSEQVDHLFEGRATLTDEIKKLVLCGAINEVSVRRRPSHINLV